MAVCNPERQKYIRGRTLGTDYEKEQIQELIQKGIRERELAAAEEESSARAREEEARKKHIIDNDNTFREQKKTPKEEGASFLGVHYSTVYDPARDYYVDPVAILFIHSELQLVTDLQTCIKAQYSEAYAEKVKLSNLQKAARTICYIQEQGIGSREELQAQKKEAENRMTEAETALKRTEGRIREINEQIHYTGQYLSLRPAHKGYQKALVKPLYRHQHEKDLDRYDEAVQYFRKKGMNIPSLKDLKQQKADLLAKKSAQENDLRFKTKLRNDMRTASLNVNWIFSEDSVRRKDLQGKQFMHSHQIENLHDDPTAIDDDNLAVCHSENSQSWETLALSSETHGRPAGKKRSEPSL